MDKNVKNQTRAYKNGQNVKKTDENIKTDKTVKNVQKKI